MKRVGESKMRIAVTFSVGLEQHAKKMQDELSVKGHLVSVKSFNATPSDEELGKFIKDAEVYVVGGLEKITAKVINSARNLFIIMRFGAGYDNIDLPAATRRKVWVTNVPGENADSVAELTLALMLALARRIPFCHNLVQQGGWKIIVGQELKAKTLGIIGLGAIGKSIVKKVQGLEMNIIGHDIKRDKEFSNQWNVKRYSLENLLRTSDFVSIHLPLTEKTKKLISSRELSIMKKNAYLINTSRGGVIDEEALVKVLKESEIAGAGLDVLSTEPPPSCELQRMDNVVLTPHIGGSTYEAISRTSKRIVENILRIQKGKKPFNIVN
ncbi:unnamed protein product [marine sediment metagenome]|uniref:3-phosphoglycerate dehydrogenase n=1 Tax=marine sediment metagenome TaxID=412755 RepID=X1MI36_9ZZZZ